MTNLPGGGWPSTRLLTIMPGLSGIFGSSHVRVTDSGGATRFLPAGEPHGICCANGPGAKSRLLTPTPMVELGDLLPLTREKRRTMGMAPSPKEAEEHFRRELPYMRKVTDVVGELGTTMQRFDDPGTKLEFAERASRVVTEGFRRFTLLQQLSLMHFFAMEAADLMPLPLPRSSRDSRVSFGMSVLRRTSMAVDHLEQRLLLEPSAFGGKRAQGAKLIADVHRIFAWKGEYNRFLYRRAHAQSLQDEGGGKRTLRFTSRLMEELRLVSVVLRLLDARRRYEVAGWENDRAQVQGLLEQLRASQMVPEEPRSWALIRLSDFFQRNFERWEALAGKGDAKQLSSEIFVFQGALSELTRGLYLFSPFIFAEAQAQLLELGQRALAGDYAKRSEMSLKHARAIGLF